MPRLFGKACPSEWRRARSAAPLPIGYPATRYSSYFRCSRLFSGYSIHGVNPLAVLAGVPHEVRQMIESLLGLEGGRLWGKDHGDVRGGCSIGV